MFEYWLLKLQFVAVLVLVLISSIAIAKPLHIFVSIAPQRLFVERIAGAEAQIEVLVQPGQDPHTFEPSSRIIAELAHADVYFAIGVPFEMAWMSRIKAVNPHMDVINSVDIESTDVNEHANEHQHDVDPHTWTNPALVKDMGLQLRDYLIRKDAINAAIYIQNYNSFRADLDVLDADIRAILTPSVKPCRFMVFHPAWGHFAVANDLIQIPVEQNGKSPGAKTFVKLVSQAKDWKLRTVFVQPQFDRKTVETLANAIYGQVEILDTLVENYFSNLRQVATLIARSCVK